MTWTEYGKRSLSWPNIVRSGTLLYYAANHTYKPDDPQIAEIQKLWSEFRPDIAPNEGGNPPFAPTIEEAVTRYGEAGLIRFLARRDDVPVVSIDPSRSEETAYLSKRFTREQIKMFHLVRGVAQQIQNHNPPKVDDEFDPMKTGTLFNDMSRMSSEYRDRYMIEMLQRHLRARERVFAVVGGTHVVMQEPALNPATLP